MAAETTVEVDAELYSVSVIESAIYRLALSLAGRVSPAGNLGYRVYLAAKQADLTEEDLQHLFHTQLVDESLREKVDEKTTDLRNLILAHAFSRSGIIGPDPDEQD